MDKGKGTVVQSERLRDQIYRLIRQQLRLGAVVPGERLKEVSLAKKLGVSRTPIREALFQLASDGLLVEADRGYMLPIHTVEEIVDRLEIRKLLEPEIIRRACAEATPKQIKALVKAVEEEKKYIDVVDPGKFIGAHAHFREMLLSTCKNRLLARSAELYDDQYQSFRIWGLQDPKNRKLTATSHEKICNAIKSNKPNDADKTFQQLISKVEDLLEDYQKDIEQ
ncbi:MAG: GntR family transcriptional regulator [Gammaproteobacteria bacterium]|jgi:DNA-binding GntR family transcriptional regulator|nr:GntR family transcriptional regulator [Gammaproteobacteria bacterium]